MIDLDKYTREYWAMIRRHAYRLTGSLLDAEDVVQETMLRAVEMGPALDSVPDHAEWLHVASTEAALEILRRERPLPLDDFDLPDLIQTTGPGADEATRPLEGDPAWPGTPLEFLFPLQYMTPEQRAVVVLRDGAEDGDRLAASALGVTLPEVLKIAEDAEAARARIRKRWGRTVPFEALRDDAASARVFARFLEALAMGDKVLLQGLLWKDAELVVAGERRTGDDFVATACAEIVGKVGEGIRFTPVWLNGCRGALAWNWRDRRSEWLRVAAVMVLCNETAVRAVKWWLDGHLLRQIEADEPK